MSDYPSIYVTVDVAVLTILHDELHALAIRRGGRPYEGQLALPGGFVDQDEDLDTAARRELSEETAIDVSGVHVQQLRAYGSPDRDPRARTVSVAYLAVVPDPRQPQAGTDAASAEWWPLERLGAEQLAFDHRTILADAVERMRAGLEQTPLATGLCGAEFTMDELRWVYEIVWGQPLEPEDFHRRATGASRFVLDTGRTRQAAEGPPARLYRRGAATVLHPAILREPVERS